jgi:hypothetical protein
MKTIYISRFFAVIFALATVTNMVSNVPAAGPTDKKTPTYAFSTSRKAGSLDRVVVQFEISGELKEKEGGKTRSTPLSGTCDQEYDEKTLAVPGAEGGRWRSIRAYDKASTVIKRGDVELKPALRTERSLIAVQVGDKETSIFSPQGSLTRDELESTDILGNSLLLEQFLPEKRIEIGQSWKQPGKLLALLLDLDSVEECEVESTLKEVTDTVARFEITGKLEGVADDVTTQIELTGKYRFDRRLQRIDWFGLVLKESRKIGQVNAGFNITSRLQVRITPKTKSDALSDSALKDLPLEPTAELTQLSCGPVDGGWQLSHDRRWHLYREQSDFIVLRMIDGGQYVGQCNISSLPNASPGKTVTLKQFQEDTRRALSKSFGEFVSAAETDSANHHICRLVIRGEASDIPIQWNYYLVSDDQGHQAVFAFTTEEKLIDRLGKADEQLVRAIQFVDRKSLAEKKTDPKKETK